MAHDADRLVDARRLRRRLTLWRSLAVFAAVVAVIGVAWAIAGRDGLFMGQHVARVTIAGVITGDRATLRLLDEVRDAEAARAVVLVIDSPGGTVTGAEALHEAIRRLAERKPLVAVINNTAASGGYIAAMGAERIVARRNAVVGSIGVIFQFPDVTRLLESVGIKVEAVRSTPLKATPSGIEPTSPEARAAVEALVRDAYDWFQALVASRRGLSGEALARASDGRVFSGQQAKDLGLVDEVGAEREALAWLVREKGIPTSLKIQDYRRRSRIDGLASPGVGEGLWQALAPAQLRGLTERTAAQLEVIALDGLLALWHPPSQ